jgi:hypothetical protein
MNIHNQFARSTQVLEEVELLDPQDILHDDFDAPVADDATIDHPFWSSRAEHFADNMTKGAILHAWREGETGSVEAINALLAYDVLDFELAMQLLSDHDRAMQMMVSPVEVPAGVVGRAV